MNIRHNENLREALASEYVLGTLRAGARRRFEAWLREDAALRRSVAEWQDRIFPMAELPPAASPPAAVWRKIERALDAQQALPATGQTGRWRDSLAFWRRFGLVTGALATMLVAYLLILQPEMRTVAPAYVAVLADKEAHTALVVTGDLRHAQLQVKMLSPQAVADNKSLELWALPKQGNPRSLGLIPASGTANLKLPGNLPADAIPALAVSLEPRGGSPDPHGPTGPVLYTGAWVKL